MTTTTTDTHRVILAAAAAREGGAVLPLPNTLKLVGAARDRLLIALLDRGLLQQIPGHGEEPIWRRGDDGTVLTLAISATGLRAIGIEPAAESPPAAPDGGTADGQSGSDDADGVTGNMPTREGRSAATLSASPNRASGPPPTFAGPGSSPDRVAKEGAAGSTPSKQDIVLAALRRPGGATLAALMQATGWQAHSVRGFLSATVSKKLGLPLVSEKVDGVRHYRIVTTSEGTATEAETTSIPVVGAEVPDAEANNG